MRYLIVQDWANTHGNHAGMVHMCNLLKQEYPDEYCILVKDVPHIFNLGIKRLNRIVRFFYERFIYPMQYVHLCKSVMPLFKKGDEIFLLEYLFPETSQFKLACVLHKKYPFLKIYGMSHLTPTYGEKKYSDYRQMVLKWLSPINKYLTLGASLTDYFVSLGVPCNCVSTGFHYVDGCFYSKKREVINQRLKVIVVGAMARNFDLLKKIICATPEVDWTVCKGNKNVSGLFDSNANVQLLGFMPENELRNQMSLADVSLSVMDDTVGSNVVTTSLSMGLAQIVSDVGSIRDYCSDDNTIFCQNTVESFVAAVKKIDKDRDFLEYMKKNAVCRSRLFCIQNVHKWFSSL